MLTIPRLSSLFSKKQKSGRDIPLFPGRPLSFIFVTYLDNIIFFTTLSSLFFEKLHKRNKIHPRCGKTITLFLIRVDCSLEKGKTSFHEKRAETPAPEYWQLSCRPSCPPQPCAKEKALCEGESLVRKRKPLFKKRGIFVKGATHRKIFFYLSTCVGNKTFLFRKKNPASYPGILREKDQRGACLCGRVFH